MKERLCFNCLMPKVTVLMFAIQSLVARIVDENITLHCVIHKNIRNLVENRIMEGRENFSKMSVRLVQMKLLLKLKTKMMWS